LRIDWLRKSAFSDESFYDGWNFSSIWLATNPQSAFSNPQSYLNR